MEPGKAGTPAFWRVAVALDFPQNELDVWMRIVKMLAILTPRGNRGSSVRLHDPAVALGTTFCDGGNPGWPPPGSNPAPRLSEPRLARFLALAPNQRGESLERIVRMLTSSRDSGRGICCTEIAHLLLDPADEQPLKNVAYAYYARLDRATRHPNQEGTH
jgi:CRISPR system Cascade subunit CasB